MRLIDADKLLTDENYEKYLKDILIEGETGEMYIRPKDVADLIAGTPTVIHLCKVCKYMNSPWYSETCDGCTGRECNFIPIDPVKHGRWEYLGKHYGEDAYACSQCERVSFGQYRYCPNCGARMEGADDENV